MKGFDARCGLRKIADYARATSADAVAAAACALCSTSIIRRLLIDAMCVARTVRCASGAVTRPRAQSTISFFRQPLASAARAKQHSEHPRGHAAVIHQTHGGVIDYASAPCHSAAAWHCRTSGASRWHGLASRAMPFLGYE